MPRPSEPGSARRPSARDLQRERARAAGSRRLLPWALLSALGGGAIAFAAGGGLGAGVTIAALGLVFVLFLWMTSVPRCPSCGALLPARREVAATGDALEQGAETCSQCRTRFE
jgi:hypothetical protein